MIKAVLQQVVRFQIPSFEFRDVLELLIAIRILSHRLSLLCLPLGEFEQDARHQAARDRMREGNGPVRYELVEQHESQKSQRERRGRGRCGQCLRGGRNSISGLRYDGRRF